mmetsp:Transcript_21217/g.63871  ORF Transcript_21217/g.63871 Transcript_21217/m.63871 type:complete len:243 (+) Transcript_21217:420-1148(+)
MRNRRLGGLLGCASMATAAAGLTAGDALPAAVASAAGTSASGLATADFWSSGEAAGVTSAGADLSCRETVASGLERDRSSRVGEAKVNRGALGRSTTAGLPKGSGDAAAVSCAGLTTAANPPVAAAEAASTGAGALSAGSGVSWLAEGGGGVFANGVGGGDAVSARTAFASCAGGAAAGVEAWGAAGDAGAGVATSAGEAVGVTTVGVADAWWCARGLGWGGGAVRADGETTAARADLGLAS